MPSGVDGVYGRTGAYESVVEALAALISRHRPDKAEVFRFAPVMPPRQPGKAGLSAKLSQPDRRGFDPAPAPTARSPAPPTSMSKAATGPKT